MTSSGAAGSDLARAETPSNVVDLTSSDYGSDIDVDIDDPTLPVYGVGSHNSSDDAPARQLEREVDVAMTTGAVEAVGPRQASLVISTGANPESTTTLSATPTSIASQERRRSPQEAERSRYYPYPTSTLRVARGSGSRPRPGRSGRSSPTAPRGSLGPRHDEEATSPAEFTVARWQPDAEVTLCPICRSQFTWVTRKHHCR